MKKFLIVMSCLFMTIVSANAQGVYVTDNGKFGDNWFVGANAGGTWSLLNHGTHNALWEGNINPQLTIKGGKYVTPVAGIQLEFEGGTLEGSKTFIDHTNLTLDWLCNLSNLFWGYNGEPRTFEVVGVLGVGWFHLYGEKDRFPYGDGKNSASAKAAVELNFNLGSSKAWQINVVPSFTYLPSNPIDNSYVGLSVGVTYKFKNSNGKHYFTKAQVRDQAEVDALVEEIAELQRKNSKLNENVADGNAVINSQKVIIDSLENVCSAVGETPVVLTNVVGFTIGSSEVAETQLANLSIVAAVLNEHEGIQIEIVGYADAGTGTHEINQTLSYNRAVEVKDILVNKYGVDSDRISVSGVGDTEQPFEENNLNRVVVFVQK